jgi:glycosyltransferase involved in cell wall biosynthesis
MRKGNYILWLPSWYPNQIEATNGDFVQRHAYAASLYTKITLIHFPQLGPDFFQEASFVSINEKPNLTEIISFVGFKPTRLKNLDKIRYNIHFYRHAKRYLEDYFRKHGLPEVVHVHVPIKAGNLARWIKAKYGVDYWVMEHSSFYLKGAPNNFFGRSRLFKLQTKKVFQQAIGVTSVSNAIVDELSKLFHLKKTCVIPNVVDTNYFDFSDKKNKKFTFIHVSNFSVEKNFEALLDTFKALSLIRKDWQLLVVGPFKQKDFEFVINNGLDTLVKFIGEITYCEVGEWMKEAHSLVLFSLNENFPCVIIEALCCGLTVVSSDVGGIKEAVNESNGTLVFRKDEKQLLLALTAMITNYHQYNTKQIALQAKAQYSYPVIGRQIFNLYSNNSLT